MDDKTLDKANSLKQTILSWEKYLSDTEEGCPIVPGPVLKSLLRPVLKNKINELRKEFEKL